MSSVNFNCEPSMFTVELVYSNYKQKKKSEMYIRFREIFFDDHDSL